MFDTDFDHAMETTLRGHPEAVMPFVVEHYRLKDGAGAVLGGSQGQSSDGEHDRICTASRDRAAAVRSGKRPWRQPGRRVCRTLFRIDSVGRNRQMQVTERERYFFDLNGYLLLKGALSNQEVADINAAIDALLPDRAQSGVEGLRTRPQLWRRRWPQPAADLRGWRSLRASHRPPIVDRKGQVLCRWGQHLRLQSWSAIH